ncbi:Vesicle-mediated ER to Golgi transport protein [Elasticomyces elasticus]|nr:Vesicle-mediated ER to Golgi transport protein [Elasticomyces elasticus]
MLKAPQKQNADNTITTLSARLSSATLLEDRRASILGLRSFAKQYPASVASGSLRGLIACLRTDGLGLGKEEGEGDVDTLRIVLETLLMLFHPDENSAEASEDVALWMADEFSQRQDNIAILVQLLESTDYYARLYSLELLHAVASARPERTQECILLAPLGTARLVTALDDSRDTVRNAALLLLTDLTIVSQSELQKLIAFEDIFSRLFNLISIEGGLSDGGIVVQDCLALLANLIRHSASNQTLFRESGCVRRLVELLQQGAPVSGAENAEWNRSNKEKNVWGLLAVIRLFLERGEPQTKTNQEVFCRRDRGQPAVIELVLDFAFDLACAPPVRTSALKTCVAIIQGNSPLQESFVVFQVCSPVAPPPPTATNGTSHRAVPPRIYIVEALLSIVLGATDDSIDIRSAACELIQAYMFGHDLLKRRFLERAIEGHRGGEPETANVLTTLLSGPYGPGKNDTLRFVFAANILSQPLSADAGAKALLMSVVEGDAAQGEDVVTAIQTLSSHLLACLQNDLDPKIVIAYLTLLITILFESSPAVSDFLSEGSPTINALLTTAGSTATSSFANESERSLLPGLCAVVLGTIYEFSTKDSPIPRRTLQPLLLSRLGRQRYFSALAQLRQHPYIRDSDVEGNSMLFDSIFVEWFKDDFSRLKRAIDRDPGLEVLPSDSANAGFVDRDVLDNLTQQVERQTAALRSTETALQDETKKAEAVQRRLEAEIGRLSKVNEALQADAGSEVEKVQQAHRASTQYLQEEHANIIAQLQHEHAAELRKHSDERERLATASRKQQDDHERQAAEFLKRQDEHAEISAQFEQRDRENTTRLRAEQDAHAEAAEQLRRERERVAELQRYRSELEQTATRLESANEQLAELREHQDDRERALTQLKLDYQAQQTELPTRQTAIDTLTAQLEAAQHEHTSHSQRARAVLEKSEQEAERLLGAAKLDAEKAREEARAARLELDDMLMVMADIEAKRDGYRERLRRVGEVVSDEEEEEEEEEAEERENGEEAKESEGVV